MVYTFQVLRQGLNLDLLVVVKAFAPGEHYISNNNLQKSFSDLSAFALNPPGRIFFNPAYYKGQVTIYLTFLHHDICIPADSLYVTRMWNSTTTLSLCTQLLCSIHREHSSSIKYEVLFIVKAKQFFFFFFQIYFPIPLSFNACRYLEWMLAQVVIGFHRVNVVLCLYYIFL